MQARGRKSGLAQQGDIAFGQKGIVNAPAGRVKGIRQSEWIAAGQVSAQSTVGGGASVLGKVVHLQKQRNAFGGPLAHRLGKRRLFPQRVVVNMPEVGGGAQRAPDSRFNSGAQPLGLRLRAGLGVVEFRDCNGPARGHRTRGSGCSGYNNRLDPSGA